MYVRGLSRKYFNDPVHKVGGKERALNGKFLPEDIRHDDVRALDADIADIFCEDGIFSPAVDKSRSKAHLKTPPLFADEHHGLRKLGISLLEKGDGSADALGSLLLAHLAQLAHKLLKLLCVMLVMVVHKIEKRGSFLNAPAPAVAVIVALAVLMRMLVRVRHSAVGMLMNMGVVMSVFSVVHF
jgi:hypothetical protein